MNNTENFKKQQRRDKFFSFQRQFRGLGKMPAKLVDIAEKKSISTYVIKTIIYLAMAVCIYLYVYY